MLWSTKNHFGLDRLVSWTLLARTMSASGCLQAAAPGGCDDDPTSRCPAAPAAPAAVPQHRSASRSITSITTTSILVPHLHPVLILVTLALALALALSIALSLAAIAVRCLHACTCLQQPLTMPNGDVELTTSSAAAAAAPLRWPTGHIPVEIFELITSHLSRAEVKTLRLVCREFEAKVSAQYFRNVVVPFKAELLSSLGARGDDGAALKPDVFSSGMRIFQSFGPHILRFALSLEVDEESLAFPPVKTVQKAVPSFWGIYRWPHDDYRRYQDLEGIERAADETDSMKEALRCLSKVGNLGLCCDAGLGFLCGPDKVGRNAAVRHPVFATQDWRRRTAPSNAASRPVVALNGSGASPQDAAEAAYSRATMVKRMTLAKMVSDAGYVTSDQVRDAVRLMLTTERTTVATIDLDGRSRPANDHERSLASLEASASQAQSYPLIPSNLTMAQMEMLLELEWAHRAMIQSYVIGLIDNASSGCFNNVTTLTLAKIPSGHLHIFCRDDLWNSIPSVKNVSLAVIADWRRISAPTPGFVEDQPVSPVQAVAKAFRLLNSHIGRQPNVESIHFEWICGGEFAPGLYHRNMYILPAPFFENPELMTTPTGLRDHADRLLNLPHAMHLSLKNCWVSPHVLLQTVRQMALCSLEKLELESVSLSGPPTTVPQASIAQLLRRQHHNQGDHDQEGPNDLAQDMLPDWMGLDPALPATNTNTPTNSTHTTQPALEDPDLMSWSGVIEHFSPGVKINQLLTHDADLSDDEVPHVGPAPRSMYLPRDFPRHDEKRYRLASLSFKSCGYAAIDLPYLDSRAVLPANTATLPSTNTSDRPDLSRHMQRCRDKMMGLVVPYLASQEQVNLETGFGMAFGWEGIYDERRGLFVTDGPAILAELLVSTTRLRISL
ncbi:hypothetical protein TOPH_06829 [Tolypocladium ophioglossoides CBS 100239]|uniref:F-box domain-containing protein n=1 Tax=Tolypocladium ophioglossoides (strain CBS 100239) TaxID=1163406 RepID=A0A0L0N3D4_TOLOC|nr:hypothetical protein TOPH_06829 [Tolypocladium ophioglossoides CBS 100239]